MLLLYPFDLKPSEYMFKTTPNLTRIFLSLALGISSILSLSAQEIPTDESIIAAGESTFKTNCSTCHEIWDVRIGPALSGVTERRSVEWLIPWIKNSQAMIAAGDEQAVALWEEYNQTVMTAYPSFSDDDVLAIEKSVANKDWSGAVEGLNTFQNTCVACHVSWKNEVKYIMK